LLGLEAFASARLLRFDNSRRRRFRRRLGRALLRGGLGAAFEALPVAAIAIVVTLPIQVAVAIAEAAMIAPERALVPRIVVAAVLARLRMRVLRRWLERRLREATLVEQIVAVILRKLVADVAAFVRSA